MEIGKVIQVLGPVIDIECISEKPDLNSLLEIRFEEDGVENTLEIEVAAHLLHSIRTIALDSSVTVQRGYKVYVP